MKLFRRLMVIFFFAAGMFPARSEETDRVIEIYLIRHARVNQHLPLFCSAQQAGKIYQLYNQSPIHSFNADSAQLYLPKKQHVVYTSKLSRAIKTAQKLFPEADTIVTSGLLNEYRLHIFYFPLIRLPYPVWSGLSRFLWWSGLNPGDESRKESLARMKQATLWIESLAEHRGSVVVVCHGYLISDIRKELLKSGWKLESANGNKNLAISKFTKTTFP